MPNSVIAGKLMPRVIGPWLVDLRSDRQWPHVSLNGNSSQDERNVEKTSQNVGTIRTQPECEDGKE